MCSMASISAGQAIPARPTWCNVHSVLITEPGTIDDLVADAAAGGYKITERLVRDWTEHGLLDNPRKRPAGKGLGSAPALYPASQRNLLLTLLHHRPGKSISSLARIPVGIWMYWGEDYVPLRQARRALMRYLGDPRGPNYLRDATRASRERAKTAARAILGQLDSPQATRKARQELLRVLTESAYTGRLDFPLLERAVRAVFEPGTTNIRRAIGHPAAPITTESFIAVTRARLTAVTELTASRVSDEMLTKARDAHLFAYAEYVARQPFLAAAPPGIPELYASVTAEDTLSNCCGHLLSALGLEIMRPAQAERLRQARAGLRLPTPAVLGLTTTTIS
jgi:hypothetical protein